MVSAVAEQPDTEALPQAKTRAAADAWDESIYVTMQDVPVFAEHETVVRDGRRLKFDRAALEQIAERCNRRIRDTGDFATITLGHTQDPKQTNGHSKPPPVVGLAGPFRIGEIGTADKRKYAILADLHVYREDYPLVKRYPRRSPELWLEDRFEEMFLDPIALLGAEAPRLDMGLLYSAFRHDSRRVVERYTAAAPSAAAVCPVSHVSTPRRGKRGKSYQAATDSPAAGTPDAQEAIPGPRQDESKEKPMALSPEDVKQIVDALEQLDWVGWVKDAMLAEQGNNSTVPGQEGPPAGPAVPPAPPEAAPAAGPPPAPAAALPPPEAGPPPTPPVGGPPGGPITEPDGDEPPPPPAEAEGGEPLEVDEDEPPKEKLAAGAPRPPGLRNTTPKATPGIAPRRTTGVRPPRRYEANATGEYQQVPEGGKKVGEVKVGPEVCPGCGQPKKSYAAGSGSMDGKDSAGPSEGTNENDDPSPAKDATVDGTTGGDAGTWKAGGGSQLRMSREASAAETGLAEQVERYRKEVEVERGKRIRAERYGRLSEMRQYLVFDLDSEMSLVEGLDDDRFEKYAASLDRNCQRIPLWQSLPVDSTNGEPVPQTVTAESTDPRARERYSKKISDQAMQACERLIAQNKQPDYLAIRDAIKRGEKVE